LNKLIDNLLHLAIEHRAITVLLAFVMLLVGIVAFQNLPMEAYPDFTNPLVRVVTLMPGKGAEEVERMVTVPLEKELNGIPRETGLRSVSIFGLSVVYVTFEDGTPSQTARELVLQRIRQADLPDSASPELDPDASPIGEIYRYTLSSRHFDSMSLKAIQDWQLERAFRQVPGVIDVNSFGGATKTYQVSVDPGRLKAYNLSINQVFDAISRSNATSGGNYIENNGQSYVVRGLGLLKGPQDLKEVVVSSEGGTPIKVKDVATISIGSGIRLGQVGKNWEDDVVQGIVLMRRGEEPSKVIQDLYAKLPAIQAALPAGVELKPLYDRAELIRHTLDTIGHNVTMGIVLVVAILLLFLFEVRSALIAAAVIPFSLLFAFMLLVAFHIPANLLSLGAVDFGILVDGTVVLVENIYRRLAHEGHDLTVEQRVKLCYLAARDVGQPIFFATIIIAAAFVPIFAFDGVAGKLFHPLAFTMNFALLGAVLATLTIIPVLCSFFLTKKPLIERESPVLVFAEKIYRPLLSFHLRRPLWLIGISTIATVVCLGLFGQVGSEFLPSLDEGNIWLRVTVLPNSVALEKSVQVAHQVRQKLIANFPEIKNIISQLGAPDDGTDPNLPSNIEFLVDLHPANTWRAQWHEHKESLVTGMDKRLEEIPGILTTFSQYIQDNVDEAIAGAKGMVAIKVYGPDLGVLQKVGNQIAGILNSVPGMNDVATDRLLGQPQYRITVDRDEAARYGINISDINQVIEVAVGGKIATQMVEGERKFNILVRLNEQARNNMSSLEKILINTPSGTKIPLSEVANIQASTGATTISRADSSRVIIVKANVRGRDLGGTVAEAQAKVNRIVKLPDGYRVFWGGQFENQQRANARLAVAIPITIGVIFLILFASFRRVRDTLIIMSSVPLVAIGGISALMLTHTYFSVSAGVGFIAAAGVSVQNGVIILAYIKQLRHMGLPKYRAILRGSYVKLRPVLMAGSVATLGLLPAAMSNGIGSQSQKPFAIVIIGGLLVATLVSIFLIPVLYASLDDRHVRFLQRKSPKHKHTINV
jgi:cobalt-zinc-cadmium resistance protein CzcA